MTADKESEYFASDSRLSYHSGQRKNKLPDK